MSGITLKRAVDGYLLAKEAEGKSSKTIVWYRRFLVMFSAWLQSTDAGDAITAVTADHIRGFLKHLREPHPINDGHKYKKQFIGTSAPRTVLGAYATLSSFFNWSKNEGLIAQSPTTNMKRPKVPKTISPVFNREEVQALLSACDGASDEATSARYKAIIMVFLDTGMRLGELVTLDINRLNLTDSSAEITGKGAKDRVVYLGAQAKKVLWRYITLFRPEPSGVTTRVFLNTDGTPIRPERVNRLLKEIARRAEITNVHPHRFRHTAAVQFLRNGGNVFALQKMLGHSTLDMVRYYVELSQEDVKKVHKTASPADNWGLG